MKYKKAEKITLGNIYYNDSGKKVFIKSVFSKFDKEAKKNVAKVMGGDDGIFYWEENGSLTVPHFYLYEEEL